LCWAVAAHCGRNGTAPSCCAALTEVSVGLEYARLQAPNNVAPLRSPNSRRPGRRRSTCLRSRNCSWRAPLGVAQFARRDPLGTGLCQLDREPLDVRPPSALAPWYELHVDAPRELAEWHERFFGAAGRAWIAALPDLATAGLRRWNLSRDGPARFGAVALVLPVRHARGAEAVTGQRRNCRRTSRTGSSLKRKGPERHAEWLCSSAFRKVDGQH
jgi:hypothetical protein